ncbi:cysteine-rich receptor-like protein kinase 15 [Diospyros lotus]|uniref:cysteine-rich receptor-like protein kinase 15 n=1 Tax=Diospyros lotus TaxID=55363 RepID=UPI00224D9331|nr:cysteine-rich receptor-like protein kinase 15 [Diospyros lotus]
MEDEMKGQILLILSLLFCFVISFTTPIVVDSYERYHFCSNASTYTPDSAYGANLQALLSALSDAADTTTTGFYNSTAGDSSSPSDQVHGLFLCRGDVSPDPCLECVSTTITEIQKLCPEQREAIIWDDHCTLWYSNQSRSAFSNNPDAVAEIYNRQDIKASTKTEFKKVLGETLRDVANRAATSQSAGKKFATKEASFGTANQKLYTLAQCTPDLSISACNSCLADAISELSVCCEGKRGARILTPLYNVRYEIYPFYYLNAARSPPASAVPPPPNSPNSPGNEGSKRKRTIIIATITSGSAMLLAIGVLFYRSRRKRREKDKENSQEVQLIGLAGGMVDQSYSINTDQTKSSDFPTIQLDLILAATAHFFDENKLGEGGFGPVYKGTLPNGREIAVKRLSRTSHQGLQEFKNEVTLIARLQHKNLVKLLGCCLEGNESLLIYEYMPNKSLDVWLFDSSKSVELDWKMRIFIISGIARGILYLHEDSRLRIIHRDLKPSNILLDNEMNPKISDFGMARIFGGNQNQANTKRVAGTYGYMAPEYAMEGLFSVKSDVFSFGVLLLEIISGKKNTDFHLSANGHNLLTFAWELWLKGQALELVDPLLAHSSDLTEVLKCIHIGLLCVQKDPTVRPIMSSVVVMLASNNMALPQPTEPTFYVGQLVLRSTQPTSSANEASLSNISPR